MGGKVITGDCIEKMRELEECSVDAVVTDPPYGLSREPDISEVFEHWLAGDDYQHRGGGFMGQSWDSFVPGPTAWRECLRVLRPGGHLLAFAGSRTSDLMGLSIRLAGFEIRDSIMWLYGSGFPKSLDVSKAIDKRRFDSEDKLRVTTWLADAADRNGVSRAAVDQHMGTSDMAGWWLSRLSHRCAVPTLDQVPALLEALRLEPGEVPGEIAELLIDLNGMKGQPGEAWFKREVVGRARGAANGSVVGLGERPSMATEYDQTVPALPEAEQWDGWGTALKPAHEPIVVARKPLVGSVAENVLEHGTGAINVDACRIGSDSTVRPNGVNALGVMNDDGWEPSAGMGGSSSGRWPANAVFSHTEDCNGECAPGCPVAMLYAQTGELVSGPESDKGHRRNADRTAQRNAYGGFQGQEVTGVLYGDRGGASRFFYCAKTSRAERNAGLEGFAAKTVKWSSGEESPGTFQSEGTERAQRNHHPTVKPINLMRWLVRMVTPPGGLVLDPFTGSGSTGCAAALEGFDFLGIEREPEYVAIAEARIAFWAKHEGREVEDVLGLVNRSKSAAKKHDDLGQGSLLDPAPEGEVA